MEEVEKCLHCGNGQPYYCEECYQELVAENLRLQAEVKELEQKLNDACSDYGD